ncbi:MAG: GNAT family N-acetyltransferase [Gammaproteobacteria bacterium]|nr:GNAT family N-acetyltransferase [Gammaproteobacteria bacterium]MCH9743326.1 GNAT family N-acetyltransferase [Gammaproteobacteria bacterium]
MDSSPELLSAEHSLETFDSGVISLDDWLRRRALKNQVTGASRTFVVCKRKKVIGYYCLSAGAIARENAPKRLRRNMPDPLPVLVLGRLAIDVKYHNQGLGSALLRDVMFRVIHVSEETGIFAILVHAISEQAKQFYLSRGFVESPLQPMTLMMTIKTITSILREKNEKTISHYS